MRERRFALVRIVALVVAVALLRPGVPAVAAGGWTVAGPTGGEVTFLSRGASRIYAGGASGGLFASDDQGATWRRLGSFREGGKSTSYGGGFVVADGVAELPGDPSVLFAAMTTSRDPDGLYRSRDAGASWTYLDTPGSSPIVDVVSAGSNPPSIYVAREDRVLRSRDGGETWIRRDAGLDGILGTLEVHPDRPATVFAGTTDGLYRSVDSGQTWTRLRSAFRVRDIAIEGGAIYFTEYFDVWRSDDDGATFEHVAVPGDRCCPTVSPAGDGALFGARWNDVYVSHDSGATWEERRSGLPEPSGGDPFVDGAVTSLLALDPQTVLAGTPNLGVWRTSDAGVTWMGASDGLINTHARGIALVPGSATRAFVATYSGVHRTTDGGRGWDPSRAGMLASAHGDEVIPSMSAIAISPSDPRRLYAGGSRAFRSSDGGATWTALDEAPGSLTSLAVDPLDRSIVYAGRFAGGVWYSRDGGDSWRRGKGFYSPHDTVVAVVVHPRRFARLYAATENGIYRSKDRGATWRRLGARWIAQGLAVVPTRPVTIWAATWTSGVRVSRDGGDTWRSRGLYDRNFRAIVVHPRDRSLVFAAAYGKGVYRSRDGGRSWKLFGRRTLGNRYPSALALSDDGSRLFVVTHNGGTYVRSL